MINITNLSNTKTKGYVFADLDLSFQEKKVSGNNRNSEIAPGNDLVIDYDEDAIKNSIRNLLVQRRYLSNAGTNLKQYIGEQTSSMNAIALGESIERSLALYEPRIKVQKIFVGTSPDESAYFITMAVKLLNFNSIVTWNATFDRQGTFEFINR